MTKDYEVVISGVSGTFPECLNLQELEENLYSDENLVNDTNAKWRARDIPRYNGKIKESTKFDDTYFGIHSRLATVLDPHAKHSFEQTFEAICDSGRNPADFFGTKTAVIMASCINETEGENILTTKLIGHLILGYSRCMQSNRTSYAFNFKGPSLTLIGSWDGAMQALAMAQNLIKKGYAKQAVVGASNMVFYPQISGHFQELGKLNKDGKTKSFSADADGYSRSDGIITFFLQRAEDAYRSYGSIVKVMSRVEMANKSGLIDPYGFSKFLGEFYEDLPINSQDIAFVEGDGCASLKIDAMELEGLAQVICPGRTKPLPVTCVKSKIGHCEGAAPFMSIVNVLIAMKTGYIPPVLHYSKPNPLVPALKDGRIKVVTEKTPLEGTYVGVTTIGLTSSFGHAVLKINPRSHPPTKPNYFPEDGVPRLFLLSGRDDVKMKEILAKIEESPIDNGLYWLNHTLFRKEFPKHLYRGFSIKGEGKSSSQVIPYPGGAKRPLWFIFSGMGSQWPEMGKGIMKIPLMRKSIEKCHKILEPKGLNLIKIITDPDPKTYDNILHCFVGIAAIQIALVDLLDELGIKADGMVGHSVGELGCSYADRGLTAEQMILAAWARGTASNEAKLEKGMMAAVGRGYNDLKYNLPAGVEIACHNSDVSCTLSGPTQLVDAYVGKLKSQGVFAKLVNVANIAYHSKYIAPAAPLLLKYLKEIIPEPKKRSSKWISSSVPENKWDSEAAQYCSAEYHTNNLLSYVLFEEASKHVPKNAICVEIAPHGLLQAIVKKSLPKCTHIPLTNRSKLGCSFILEALAMMFSNGVELDLTKLYPPVELPLPRETAYIHPIFAWNHTEDWVPLSLERDFENIKGNLINKEIELASHPDELYNFSLNHRINAKSIYPTSNLLCKVIEYVDETFHEVVSFKKYLFQDLKFNQQLILDKKSNEKLNILYQIGSGKFEAILDKVTLAMGVMNPLAVFGDSIFSDHLLQLINNREGNFLNEEDVYQFFEDKECFFNDEFRNITDVRITDKAFVGRVKWRGSVEFYFDALLKLIILYSSIQSDSLTEIDRIDELIFDPSLLPEEDTEIFVYYDAVLKQLSADGVKMSTIKTRQAIIENTVSAAVKKFTFSPFTNIQSQDNFLSLCLQIVHEFAGNDKINVIGKEKCQVYEQILHTEYYKSLIESKANINAATYKELNILPEEELCSHLFISNAKLPDSLVNMINSSNQNCYLIQSCSESDTKSLTKFQHLTPILERSFDNNKLVFYKKTINVMADSNFIQVPEGYIIEKPSTKEEFIESKKINFLLFKYKSLSQIPLLLEANRIFLDMKCIRFVFTDYNSPSFDPTDNFYLLHLKKDFKISLCQNNMWGSLKKLFITVPSQQIVNENRLPLNTTRCNGVDLKTIGINLLNTMSPSYNDKVSLVDYAGIRRKGQEEVMGIAKMSTDNNLQADSLLYWKKPKQWTSLQAATVPVIYSMAYYLLEIKTKPDQINSHRVFVHGGHTIFSQTIIKVAFGMKAAVYTSCFTLEQKKSILKRFPQLKESHVFVLKEGSKYMMDYIMTSTEGQGITIAIDCLNEDEFRNITMQCLGKNGKYFLVCHNEMKTEFSFGMSIFMRETSVMGFNPELIFDMSQEDKKILVKLVEQGIQNGVVTPLEHITMDGNKTRKDVIETVVTTSQSQSLSKKVIVSVEKTVEYNSMTNGHNGISSDLEGNRNFMIIGSFNSIWFDLVNWLAVKGANNIYVITDWNSVPNYVQIRYKSFMKRYSNVNVRFLGLEHLNSAESFQSLLQRVCKDIEETFYIAPGLDNKLDIVDNVLRKFCKECSLICIGPSQTSHVIDNRRHQGFKGMSFILKRNNLRNRTIVNILDHCHKEFEHDKQQIILMDEIAKDIISYEANILPRTSSELMDMMREASVTANFKELSNLGLTYQYAKDIDPVFFFPGFRISKVKKVISKLNNPCFIATYPSHIKSLDEIASQLTKDLLNNFDQNMFTFVSEGWSGPLVLKVVSELESKGKVAAVMMIDSVPRKIRKWTKIILKSDNIISRSLPSFNQNEEITVDHLKQWKDNMSEIICKEDCLVTTDEVKRGLDIMINRLELVENIEDLNMRLLSKIHLISACDDPIENHLEIAEMNLICEVACSHHVIENATCETLLDSKELLQIIKHLMVLEYKCSATKQSVASISTLELKDFR